MNDGRWLSLMDYASKKNISLSTLRRYIKSNKVLSRLEKGKYFIWDNEIDSSLLTGKMDQLHTDLQKAQEEIVDLKTLIAFYENLIP